MKFELSNIEVKRLKTWKTNHIKKCCPETFSVMFTPTGIGDYIEVICNKCKKSKNITDYSEW